MTTFGKIGCYATSLWSRRNCRRCLGRILRDLQLARRGASRRKSSMCSPDRSWVDDMQLASRDGHSLDLKILGYQFPHLETQQYDSNWLIVSGNVTGPIGSWQFSDPFLLTYEAERLASWMDAVADGNRPSY